MEKCELVSVHLNENEKIKSEKLSQIEFDLAVKETGKSWFHN